MSREELPDWLWPMDFEAKVKTNDDDEDEQCQEQDDDHGNQLSTKTPPVAADKPA